MKISTAKSMARNLLSTKSGQKVSDTAFKKFIKEDKSLKKLTYSADNSTVSKLQAKKILGQVAQDAAGSQKYKVSRFAQKLGIKQSGGETKVSDISLEKVYQKGTEEELAASAKPAGPTKDELRRQKRHDEAIKTFHKHDRADEMRKDQLQEQPKNQPTSKRAPAPLTHAGPSGIQQASAAPAAKSISNQVSSGGTTVASAKSDIIPVVVLPIMNQSGSVEQLNWLLQKIDKLIKQTLTSTRLFKIVDYHSSEHGEAPDVNDEQTLRLITKRSWARLCVYGSIKKLGNIVDIDIEMFNIENDQHLSLVKLKTEADDIFNLERKVSWQINDSIMGTGVEKTGPDLPTKKITDLPI